MTSSSPCTGLQRVARLEDLVEDRHSPKPMDQAMDAHLHAQIRKALATLPPRQEKVIRMRFGVGEPRDYTAT